MHNREFDALMGQVKDICRTRRKLRSSFAVAKGSNDVSRPQFLPLKLHGGV
jgi:hypothetical protein